MATFYQCVSAFQSWVRNIFMFNIPHENARNPVSFTDKLRFQIVVLSNALLTAYLSIYVMVST